MGVGGRGYGGHTIGARAGQQRGNGPRPCSSKALEAYKVMTDTQSLRPFYIDYR